MIWDSGLPYFTDDELRCKCGCKLLRLDIRFAAQLPALREAWNSALTVTSCCRCPAHNKAVGGHPSSLHLTDNPKHLTDGTMAVDVSWVSWGTDKKLRFARLAYGMGWRVGLHSSFCHLDRGIAVRIPHIVFLYGEWSNVFTIEEVTAP